MDFDEWKFKSRVSVELKCDFFQIIFDSESDIFLVTLMDFFKEYFIQNIIFDNIIEQRILTLNKK